MDGQLFAVTTRSRLKAPWLFPSMMMATRRVRRQLADDPTVVRWASVVAGPLDFWTITVWRSRHDMHEFMRSGAHEDIMWDFSKLLESFWLMRWRPSAPELGYWNGLRLSGTAPAEASPEDPAPSPATGPTTSDGFDESEDGRRQRLDQALAHLPKLAAATGPDGRAAYEHSAFARARRAEVGGAAGLVLQVHLERWQSPQAIDAMRRLRAAAKAAGAVRAAVGTGKLGEAYLLALWREGQRMEDFVGSTIVADAVRRWGDRFWLSSWEPENEFGHWDGLRVRRRRRPVIAMPAEAARLGD